MLIFLKHKISLFLLQVEVEIKQNDFTNKEVYNKVKN